MIPLDPALLTTIKVPALEGARSAASVLKAGAITEIKVSTDPQTGQRGITMNGIFLPAVLPDNVKVGQKLSVAVQSSIDALVLKILSDGDKPKATTKPAPSLRDLKLLITSKESEHLREALQEIFTGTSKQSAPRIPQSQSLTTPPQLPATTQPGGAKFVVEARTASTLSAQDILVDNATEKPEAITRALTKLALNGITKAVEEAKQQVEKLGVKANDAGAVRLLDTLRKAVDTLLERPEMLSFDPPSTEDTGALQVPIRREQLVFLATTARALIESGSPPEILSKLAQRITPKDSPLTTLLNTLKALSLDNNESSTITKEVLELVKGLTHELALFKDRRSPATEVHDALRRFAERATTKATQLEQSEIQERAHTARLLERLESVSAAQDTLARLAPIVSALGEPTMVMFPLLFFGDLFVGGLTAQPRTVQPDPEHKESETAAPGFTKIELSLNLPHLGHVQLELAHRPGEALLAFHCASPEVMGFMQQHLELLATRIREHDVESPHLSVDTALKPSIVPDWVMALGEKSIIA